MLISRFYQHAFRSRWLRKACCPVQGIGKFLWRQKNKLALLNRMNIPLYQMLDIVCQVDICKATNSCEGLNVKGRWNKWLMRGLWIFAAGPSYIILQIQKNALQLIYDAKCSHRIFSLIIALSFPALRSSILA